jgi:hypothetical protein
LPLRLTLSSIGKENKSKVVKGLKSYIISKEK